MNVTKKAGRLLPAFAILILAAGCGGDSNEPAQSGGEVGEPVSGGSVVITEGADMVNPHAILAQSAFDGNLGGDIMFLGMLKGDWEDGRLVFRTAEESPMALARRYEYFGPDSASIRFFMRSDVKWSDGQPVRAADAVFSYGILGNPDVASPQQNYTDDIESVVAENDSTVVFNFTRRYPDMLTHASLQLLPEHIYRDVAPGEIVNHATIRNPENGNFVVNGPYMIGTWERGQRVVLVRNPHFQPAGYLDQIVFRIIPDPITRIVELQTGTVDFVQSITLDQVARIRTEAPHVRLEREEKRFYDYVAYNPEGFAPFADPNIRRAMGLAVNVPEMLEALEMTEFAVPAGGPYAPIFRDLYDPQGQAPLQHNPDEARRILTAAGWSDTNNDGILDKDGQPFRFTLITNAGNQRRADVSQILQSQWRQIGVDAEIQILEFNLMSENLQAREYQAAMGGWSVGLSPDLTTLWAPDSPFNYTGYENPEVTRLIESARAAPTVEEANPLWRQAASGIVRDQPYTWLFFLDSVDGVNNRVQGTKIDTYGPYQNVWEWWIPASQQ